MHVLFKKKFEKSWNLKSAESSENRRRLSEICGACGKPSKTFVKPPQSFLRSFAKATVDLCGSKKVKHKKKRKNAKTKTEPQLKRPPATETTVEVSPSVLAIRALPCACFAGGSACPLFAQGLFTRFIRGLCSSVVEGTSSVVEPRFS